MKLVATLSKYTPQRLESFTVSLLRERRSFALAPRPSFWEEPHSQGSNPSDTAVCARFSDNVFALDPAGRIQLVRADAAN